MEFIHWLSTLPAGHQICIECGAGEAEVARFLSQYFRLAIAADINPPAKAYPASDSDRISYIKSAAENLPLPSGSVDMVVSMQALHHFDVPAHLVEAGRVLRRGGVFAALAWGEIRLPDDVRIVCQDFLDLAARFWEPERDWVVNGYPDLEFDGECIGFPHAAMHRKLTPETLMRVFQSWSAYRSGIAILPCEFAEALEKIRCHSPAGFDASWPIVGRIFRKKAS